LQTSTDFDTKLDIKIISLPMTFFAHIPDEEEEIDEEEGAIDDDLLAELDPLEDEVEDPLTGGFGEVPEEEEKAIEKASEKSDDDEDGDEPLEEDAEDVDFDTFDDVDEF
jgi:hypothetical protein